MKIKILFFSVCFTFFLFFQAFLTLAETNCQWTETECYVYTHDQRNCIELETAGSCVSVVVSINIDPITGGPYDAAWLSHILHSSGPDECYKIIAKTVEVMKPGGLIMIHEFILENTKDAPEFGALFSLNMLIHNAQGCSYSENELTEMLDAAGVRDIYRHPFRGPNDSSILCGTV